MDLYFERHDGEAATIEDFVQMLRGCLRAATSTQFMLWYSQAGTPEVIADGKYDAGAKTYTLNLSQTLAPTPGQPVKEPMVIPLACRAGRPRTARICRCALAASRCSAT